jgi:hypothetical protein
MAKSLQTVSQQLKGREKRAPFQLSLGIKRKLSRRNDPEVKAADSVFQQIRPKVLMRDNFTCQACGFASVSDQHAPSGFLEVHHIDDDHHHNEMGNLVTLCPFCHQIFTLGRRGVSFCAIPVWLPEISQAEINLLCHGMFFLMCLDDRARNESIVLSESSKDRCSHVSDMYQQLLSMGDSRLQALANPLTSFDSLEVLSGALIGLTDREYALRHLFLGSLRLVPDMTHFKEHINFWADNVWLRGVKPDGWNALIHQVAESIDMQIPS